MQILAAVACGLGLGTLAQMVAWCIATWKDATREEQKVKRFEKFSKMIIDTDLKSWK